MIVPEFYTSRFLGRSTPVRRRRPVICYVRGVGGVMIGSGPYQLRLFLLCPGISKKGAEKSPCASVVHQALTVITVPGNYRKHPGRVEPWWSSGRTWVEPGRIQAESTRYSNVGCLFSPATLRMCKSGRSSTSCLFPVWSDSASGLVLRTRPRPRLASSTPLHSSPSVHSSSSA